MRPSFNSIRSIELLTNGSLNFNKTGFISPSQAFLYKKDYKSLVFSKKRKDTSGVEVLNNIYKTHFNF